MDLTNAVWRKSSHSGIQGDCVEIAFVPEAIAVRDSKNPDGPVLTFPALTWANFLPAA